jgi:DNA helicase IV
MGSESASVDALADSVASKKQNDKALEEQQKRDAVVQELINSKKYIVPLAHDSTKMKSSKAPMTIMLLLLIVVVVAYALVDLGTIDVGFDVPYHILKK